MSSPHQSCPGNSFNQGGQPVTAAQAQEQNDRLLIVNGDNGRVVYDDGRDELFCVTRRRFVGYNDEGHRVFRRGMSCR